MVVLVADGHHWNIQGERSLDLHWEFMSIFDQFSLIQKGKRPCSTCRRLGKGFWIRPASASRSADEHSRPFDDRRPKYRRQLGRKVEWTNRRQWTADTQVIEFLLDNFQIQYLIRWRNYISLVFFWGTWLEDTILDSTSDWCRFQLLSERLTFGKKLQQTDGPSNLLIREINFKSISI